MRCPVCGTRTRATGFGDTPRALRDSGVCRSCGAFNRQRQVAYGVSHVVAALTRARPTSLESTRIPVTWRTFSAEARGPLHDRLSRHPGHVASEYLGPGHASGSDVDGIRHEDLEALSFPGESLDVVVTSDVFEHLADPYRGHAEVYRVLKDGGRHIFTVPFHRTAYHDDVRARVADSGEVEMLAEPIVHHDPLRPSDGALVFTIFGLEMLARLRSIGFVPCIYELYVPSAGIVGPNALLFEAVKCSWEWP